MDYKELNVYQKLNLARKKLLETGLDKSGKNPSLEFLYFELKDIVPPVTSIFNEVGLIALVDFFNDSATMTIVNTDSTDQVIEFSTPIKFVDSNRGTNPVMAIGSTHTYFRRYLYMLAMDIVEADSIDGGVITPEETPAPAPKKSKKPATPKERKEIKEELTAADEPADDLQKQALMNALNALLDKDSEQEEFVQKVALATDSFQNLTKVQCEQLINGIQEMLSQYED